MALPSVGNQVALPIVHDEAFTLTEAYLYALDAKEITKSGYRACLKNGWWSYVAAQNIQRPTRQDFINFKKFLLDAGYAPTTISSYLVAARGLFKFLNETLRYPDITVGVKGIRMQRGFRRDPVPLDKARELLKSIDRSTLLGKRNSSLIGLLLRTGLRTVEIIRADVADVRRVSGQRVLYVRGKGQDDKSQFVLLTDATWLPLYDYLKARGPLRECDPLFHSISDRDTGKIRRLSTRTISRIFKEGLRDINVDDPRISAHSARHFCATTSLQAGATLQETQALLRHHDINTTLIYSHNIQRVSDTAPEFKIDALLDKEAS